jgi:heme/copper-type cytochrome/quinol oxidase subunit 2
LEGRRVPGELNITEARKTVVTLIAILIIFVVGAMIVDQVLTSAAETNPNSTLINEANTRTVQNFKYVGILITFTVIISLAYFAFKVFTEE